MEIVNYNYPILTNWNGDYGCYRQARQILNFSDILEITKVTKSNLYK